MARSTHLLLLIVGLVSLQDVGQKVNAENAEEMSEICMGCICEASSSCDRTLGCADGVCGMFSITKPYWIDAGMPVIRGDQQKRDKAFERCAVDPFCAAETVHAYMKKFAKDCDGNGEVNCQDFAAIHTLGAGCQGEVNPEFRTELNKCMRHSSQSGSKTERKSEQNN